MLTPDEKYVYHGSKMYFDTVIPKRQKRRNKSGSIIFDEISFHATPYKWIGLAYTCDQKEFEWLGKRGYYATGVDLYEHQPEVEIFGVGSLEQSLKDIYGAGGYLFVFDKNDFHHTEGLGNLEVITRKSPRPISVDKIDDPVSEMLRLGVSFKFSDLTGDDPFFEHFWKKK